jgi:uncharacterized membrane protein
VALRRSIEDAARQCGDLANPAFGGSIMVQTIRNPIEYMADEVSGLAHGIERAGKSLRRTSTHMFTAPLVVRRIAVADLMDALRAGYRDMAAYRSDVLFLIGIYPLISLVIAAIAFNYQLLPLLFPIISGTAILGPFVGVVLYEMSRRREINVLRHREDSPTWINALSVTRSHNFGAIMSLGLILVVLYLLWLAVAYGLYLGLQGTAPIETVGFFVQQVLATPAGKALMVLGCAIGFLFAALALMIGVVSFPLLLDRDIGLGTAIWTSIRAVAANPIPMAAWGLIVAGLLVLGALPLFVGLVIVMPVLCHATWHLYRKLLPRGHPRQM